jgi:hypothetical protein
VEAAAVMGSPCIRSVALVSMFPPVASGSSLPVPSLRGCLRRSRRMRAPPACIPGTQPEPQALSVHGRVKVLVTPSMVFNTPLLNADGAWKGGRPGVALPVAVAACSVSKLSDSAHGVCIRTMRGTCAVATHARCCVGLKRRSRQSVVARDVVKAVVQAEVGLSGRAL